MSSKRQAKAMKKRDDVLRRVDLSTMISESRDKNAQNKFTSASKGKAEVDPKKVTASQWVVYEDAFANQYSVYMNKSDLGKNNNKFYLMQVLQSKDGSRFCVHIRYGRVGEDGAQI